MATVTIGSTALGSAVSFVIGANSLYVNKYTLAGAPAGATWKKLRARLKGGTGTVNIRLVIYANSAGLPGALIDWVALTVAVGAAEAVIEGNLLAGALATDGDYHIGIHTSGTTSTTDGPQPFWDLTAPVSPLSFKGGVPYGSAPPGTYGTRDGVITRDLRVQAEADDASGTVYVPKIAAVY